jgi:hypothetical protein
MRVNSLRGLKTLLRLGPGIKAAAPVSMVAHPTMFPMLTSGYAVTQIGRESRSPAT